MYVQIGVNPLYFQFYTPDCQNPIHAGYDRPTFAGVLTGYDFSKENEEFWELYIRRHGEGNNKVKLACVFEKCTKDGCEQRPPFAGIASKMYQIDVFNTEPDGYAEIPSEGETITTSEALIKLINEHRSSDEVHMITIPTDRLDCNNQYDLTSFDKLNNLVLQGESAIECLASISFVDGVNIVLSSGPSSSTRRPQTTPVEEKELVFDGLNAGSLVIGNNLFNDYNYKLTIKSK